MSRIMGYSLGTSALATTGVTAAETRGAATARPKNETDFIVILVGGRVKKLGKECG